MGERIRAAGLVGTLVFVLAGCATMGTSNTARVPTMEGLASWYSDSLAGRSTASGEPYDPAAWTAAHRTWPLGTQVRVTRLDTGATVDVRVNDRGPYVDGRVIDLSRAAATVLDMLSAGVVRVRLDVLAWGTGRRTPRPPSHGTSRIR